MILQSLAGHKDNINGDIALQTCNNVLKYISKPMKDQCLDKT